jgi:YesN/AraC family two-component response regulator
MGIKKYLLKPLEMGNLANIIREVLDEDVSSMTS